MFDHLIAIGNLIIASFLHTWPYLLVTIPLAVAVRMSRASSYISRAFQARPLLAIFLATAVGAFSPFCSCGVVPVVAALLIGGVPLAPVMSFWIASPSMDPEIFFLSVATLGWELAVWRLGATLFLSLGAGLVTHFVVQQGWLGQQILRAPQRAQAQTVWSRLQAGRRRLTQTLGSLPSQGLGFAGASRLRTAVCCNDAGAGSSAQQLLAVAETSSASSAAGGPGTPARINQNAKRACESGNSTSCSLELPSFWHRLVGETWDATWMVVKFMLLAFLVSALIKLYVPSELVSGVLGQQNRWAIPSAALLGVPAYTSNLTALPMLGGLLAQGMSPSAALAFLISGPTTTLPAMAAVWGLTSRRVFALYVSFSLVGAVAAGCFHSLVAGLL